MLAVGALALFVLLGFIRAAILLLRKVEAQHAKPPPNQVSR
jgi:flagellar biogenesis protein FliO